jgi:hypothetical protein
MSAQALVFLQPLLRHFVITDTLDDSGAFADSRAE